MTLEQWEKNGWLTPHKTTRQEIASLLAIVDRDLRDSEGSISPDWRFGIAYNAALKLCSVLLYAEGYRPAHGVHHYRAIQAMPLILGDDRREDADYLDACRNKRNTVEYDYVGAASEDDAAELTEFVGELREDVVKWLRLKHPELLA
jgi:hypothetical protein